MAIGLTNGLFGLSPTGSTSTNDTNIGGNQHSWFEDLLNTVIKVTDINAQKQVGIANAGNNPVYTNIDYNPPSLTRNVPVTPIAPNQQGAQVGATVGNFADKAVNFVKQNWVIFAVGGIGYVLYTTTPKR